MRFSNNQVIKKNERSNILRKLIVDEQEKDPIFHRIRPKEKYIDSSFCKLCKTNFSVIKRNKKNWYIRPINTLNI